MHTVNEKLTQALVYCRIKKYLETFLEDGRIPLSNNYWEANIKLFAKGVLYTLVESAKANKLDVYAYLKYLLTKMPNNNHQENSTVIGRLLPWSEELPEQCRLKTRQKSTSNNDVDIITEKLLYYTMPCFGAFTLKSKRLSSIERKFSI